MKLDINKLITVDVTGMPKAPNPSQLLDKDVRELSVLQSGGRERIDNPVRIRNGTATVIAEAVYKAKAGHWQNAEKARTQTEDA